MIMKLKKMSLKKKKDKSKKIKDIKIKKQVELRTFLCSATIEKLDIKNKQKIQKFR